MIQIEFRKMRRICECGVKKRDTFHFGGREREGEGKRQEETEEGQTSVRRGSDAQPGFRFTNAASSLVSFPCVPPLGVPCNRVQYVCVRERLTDG